MNQGSDKLDFLLIPFGEFLHPAPNAIPEFEPIKPPKGYGLGLGTRHPPQAGEVQDRIKEPASAVEATFFRKVTNGVANTLSERLPAVEYSAGIGLNDPKRDPNRSRLSSTVWAEEAKDLPGLDAEGYIVDGSRRREILAQVLHFKHRVANHPFTVKLEA